MTFSELLHFYHHHRSDTMWSSNAIMLAKDMRVEDVWENMLAKIVHNLVKHEREMAKWVLTVKMSQGM